MALVGNLKDLKLPNLIQLNCMERNTAKLTLEHAGKFGIIYFQNGQIVHAEYEPDIGENALFRMMILNDGKFRVESGVRPPVRSINTNWNNLLLEGLHRLDLKHLSTDSKYIRLIDMLLNVKGVIKAAMITSDGELVSGERETNSEFALHAFTFLEIEKLAESFGKSEPRFISLLVQRTRILLTRYKKHIIFIELESKYQVETILPFIHQVLD
jgi:predicted regulator of Ras-like GTPase activity (Roadblock/LC7/MglB family)